MEKTIERSSTTLKLLLRRSASVQMSELSSHTGNGDTVSRNVSELSVGPENSDTNITQSFTFDPLDDDAINYLSEELNLPPIDSVSPTKFYINPHPAESQMSSSINSMDEWWSRLNLGDEDGCCVERGYTKKREVSVVEGDPQVLPKQSTFPLTEEILRKRRLLERQREEDHRAQIISHLEKQMVSLNSIKEQYRRNAKLVGGDCLRDQGSLPSVSTKTGDQLTRQRDSIINRIRRQKLEEELKDQKRTERKLSIVKKLLREQRKIEQNRRARLLEKRERKKVEGGKKVKLIEDEEMKRSIVSDEVVQENESVILRSEEMLEEPSLTIAEIPEVLRSDIQTPEVVLAADTQQEVDMMERPEKKSSKKKDRGKKSLSGSEKGKSKKEKKNKKKKISAQSETRAATCEETAELPASQMQDLLLWFEDWRETLDANNNYIKKLNAQKLPVETNIEFKPSTVVFKDVRGGRSVRQLVTVTNLGESALRSKLAGVFIPVTEESPKLRAELDGPSKARTGNFWTLTLNLEAQDDVEDTTGEVVLMFCREDGTRSQLRLSVLVLRPRAEPVLSTTCIKFGRQVAWATGISRMLLVSNSGSLSCKMWWTDDSTSPSFDLTQRYTSSGIIPESDPRSELDAMIETIHMASEMVEIAFQKVFSLFRFEARPGVLIPPKSQISIPVRFFPTMTDCQGNLYSKYTLTFEGEHVDNEIQSLVVCGEIEAHFWTLEPQLLDMKMCYTGGCVHQAEFRVCSTVRHVCLVCSRVPPALAGQVTILPRQTLVQAKSFVTLTVRLVLRQDLYDSCPFLDRETGLLSFGVQVWVQGAGPPRELEVMAVVAPPCPLNIIPACLDLGRVTTAETVSAVIHLKNHQIVPYTFAFLNLPESIKIEPGGGVGTILPEETLSLDLLFSPTAGDLGVNCGRPGAEGEVVLTLRCFSTVSLASPVQKKKKNSVSSKGRSGSSVLSKVINRCSVTTSELSTQGSGDVAIFTTSSVVTGGSVDDTTTDIESVTTEMGGGDIKLEPTDEEVFLSKTNSEMSDVEKTSSLETDYEELWDYFSMYQLRGPQEDVRKGSQKYQASLKDEEVNEDLRGSTEESEPLIDEEQMHKSDHEILVRTDDQKEIKTPFEDILGSEESNDTNEEVPPENQTEGEESSLSEGNQKLSTSSEGIEASDARYEEPQREDALSADIAQQRYTSITVRAWVMDPLVELSSQIVLLPPTPCMSYSLAPLYLRSKPQKRCGVHEKINSFQTFFEFRSSDKQLSVEPRQGRLQQRQSMKVTIIFRPSLSDDEIFNKAFEMKRELMKWQKIQDMLEEYFQSKAKKEKAIRKGSAKSEKPGKKNKKADDSKSKKGAKSVAESKKSKGKTGTKSSVLSGKIKKSKGSLKMSKLKKKDSGPLPEVTIDPEEVEVTSEDLRAAEVWLLKYLEPKTSKARITCLIDTQFESGERRLDRLECLAVCPTDPPSLVMASSRCLDFGPTAVNTSSKLYALATNVSMFDEFAKISTLNPVGSFMCPASLETPFMIDNRGVEVPPEHFLKVPIVFQPIVDGEIVEKFELICGLTTYHLEVRGEGVTPSFSLTPDHEVFSLACAAGKKADVVISVENTCRAPLRFLVKQEFLRVGTSLPTSKQSPPLTPGSGGKPKKEKKTKAEPAFTLLTPGLSLFLENEFVDMTPVDTAEPIFKIVDVNDFFNVLAGETKQITIRFTPHQTAKSSNGTESSFKTKLSKTAKSKKGNKEKVKVESLNEKPSKKNEVQEKSSKKTKKEMGEAKKKTSVGKEKSKMVIATKYSIFFTDMRKVKDLVILGTIKK